MKSKVALVLTLAAVLAVPATYAKGPPSEPPGQAKKEEAQAQRPAADQASGGQATAQEQQPESAGAQEQSAQPATPAQPAQPAKPAAGKSAKPATPAKRATPAKPAAKPAKPAKPAGHATPAKPAAKPVTPAAHSKAPTAPRAAAAEAGKVTICHATHSATNPYVEITISANGMHGHGHHDDIVPAPAGGCPDGNRGAKAHDNPHPEKITICHATHSATNPYVEITISVNGMHGHDHHDDIVPAPAGGCPRPQVAGGASVAGGPTGSVSSGGASDSGGAAGVASVEAASASTAGIPAAEAEAAAQGAPTSGVAGVQAFGSGKPLAAKKSGGVLGTVTRSKLPFTGLPLLPFVFGGLLAIVVGAALVRRRATGTL